MVKLKKIHVLSLAKMCAVIGFVFGIIIAALSFIVFLLGTGVTLFSGTTLNPVQAVLGLFAIILLPVFYAISGLITGALTALLYNIFAGLIGGVEIELE